jgi:NTE family protein
MMKIALALSGGGFRATVFHLGVLARLAADEQDLFPQVTYLSTVSGGSLCGGLVYTINKFRWPSGKEYLEQVAFVSRHIMTTVDLQESLIQRTLRNLRGILETRSDDLSALMQTGWGVTAKLNEIPSHPRWLINATCYETAKNWRFEPHRMGDYIFGYSHDTDLPLADALAASSGFPGLIGPLVLKTGGRAWFRYKSSGGDDPYVSLAVQNSWDTESITPSASEVHLWDGGVYDNHGIEGLHDFVHGWHSNVDFLLVSDASGKGSPPPYRQWAKAIYFMVTGIMMDQIRSLRARAVVERMTNHNDDGSYVKIGNSCRKVLTEAHRTDDIPTYAPGCLDEAAAARAAATPTMIRKLTTEEFDLLFRHGFEVADYTLYAYHADGDRPTQFKYLGYESIRSKIGF